MMRGDAWCLPDADLGVANPSLSLLGGVMVNGSVVTKIIFFPLSAAEAANDVGIYV